MKRCTRLKAVNDDEWYTPYETASKVAQFLAGVLPKSQAILCPADILPDGSISTIPEALHDAGFNNVRVTRNLPVTDDGAWRDGEVIVTNPPFSLLVPLRKFINDRGIKYCILSRPGAMRKSWPIPSLGNNFKSTDGRSVCAPWQQNIVSTIIPDTQGLSIGNCMMCESKACPKNDMTGNLRPRQDRALYGASIAVKLGISGFFCFEYTVNGKRSFNRYFYPDKNNC